jgi:alpha-tubulin suppressor-like RCC1 family protein
VYPSAKSRRSWFLIASLSLGCCMAIVALTAIAPSDSRSLPQAVAPTLVVVSGNDQAGWVYSRLSSDLVVKATTAGGGPLVGAQVSFSVENYGAHGTLSPVVAITGADGQARTRWTLGGRYTFQQSVIAKLVGTSSAVTFTARARFTWRYAPIIAAGQHHTCALAGGDQTGGVVHCWGRNSHGMLGHGLTHLQMNQVPAGTALDQLGDPLRAQSVTAGGGHTCALQENGTALCWGFNGYGALGDGTQVSRTQPRPVTQSTTGPLRSLTAGRSHTCALTTQGVAYCWGINSSGQLGDGTTTQRNVPVLVLGNHRFRSIDAGRVHTCGVDINGVGWCWGANDQGALGDGTTLKKTSPVVVSAPLGEPTINFNILTAGGVFSCGIAAVSGKAYCWGSNTGGELGDGSTVTNSTTPRLVGGGLTWRRISAGGSHTCAITLAGDTYCWGNGCAGELGTGSGMCGQRLPIAVQWAGSALVHLVTGDSRSCAAHNDAYDDGAAYTALVCWGSNGSGQLGDGTNMGKTTPTTVLAPETL